MMEVKKNVKGVDKMSKIKYAANKKKKSSFFAFVPSGQTLVEVVSSPKKVVEALRKNTLNHKETYKSAIWGFPG